MLKKMSLAFMILFVFAAVPAFAAKTGCKKFNFLGSYTRVDAPVDVFGDGSAVHQYVFQLNLTADGVARQYWTGLPDYALNIGTGSEPIGSWTCRDDGKLVVTILFATYVPTNPADPNTPVADVRLFRHTRTTILFDVPDDNTLSRIQSRSRSYLPGADSTDAAGGTLGAISNAAITYRRFVASDADLLLP